MFLTDIYLGLFQDAIIHVDRRLDGVVIVQEIKRGPLGAEARARAFVSLVRPPNCLMIGLAVVVGQAISLGGIPPVDKGGFGFLTAASMMAGTMVLNDIYDLDVDRLNSPQRPLPSGRVSLKGAYYYSILLSAASLLFAVILGIYSFLVALLAFALMVYYNARAKKSGLFGNAIVSFNVALPFFFGGISVSVFKPILLLFSLLAFLSNFGREIAKGISDVQGDSAHNVRTLAVLKGTRVAAVATVTLFLLSVTVSLAPPILGIVSIWYLPIVLVADAGFIATGVWLVRDPTAKTARSAKKYVLLWMLLGLVAFLLGGL